MHMGEKLAAPTGALQRDAGKPRRLLPGRGCGRAASWSAGPTDRVVEKPWEAGRGGGLGFGVRNN